MLDLSGLGVGLDTVEGISGRNWISTECEELSGWERIGRGFWAVLGMVPFFSHSDDSIRVGRAISRADDAADVARHFPKRAFVVGERVYGPAMGDALHRVRFPKGRQRLLSSGFVELAKRDSGRITFEQVVCQSGGRTRKYIVHFDPNDAGGPNWHKYVIDEYGQLFQLNDRGYVLGIGANNPVRRAHIPGRK